MPKAKKQKNGSWRCQLWLGEERQPDGSKKQIVKSFTGSTKAEAEDMASEYRRKYGKVVVNDLTLSDAVSRYIDSKSNILSPATIRGYRKDAERIKDGIGDVQIRKLTAEIVQNWINDASVKYSPKTIKNSHGLLVAAVTSVDPMWSARVTLPKKLKKEYYIPSLDQVQYMIDRAPTDNLRKAIKLAAYGSLRRGEICALTMSDIQDGWISVTKDMIRDVDGMYIVKNMPKTLESCRKIPVPDDLIKEMRDGLVTCTPHAITSAFDRLVKREELPHMRFHDLRHFFASYLHLKGVPDAYIEKYGGWKAGSGVMKEIYRNTINEEEAAQAERIKNLFS